MRHGKKFNHLGRKAPHRKAMLSNMASSLILSKRITTTTAKAKALRKYVEPLLTKSKNDTTHSRRVVFSYLNNKESVKTLFDEVASKINDRLGGYTRIIKMGSTRLGDSADMSMIELVDYNELLLDKKTSSKSKTRRRRGKKKSSSNDETQSVPTSVVDTSKEVSQQTQENDSTVSNEEEMKSNQDDNLDLDKEVNESKV